MVVATGPLTSPPLAEAIRDLTGEQSLAFFDAIAPIVHKDSIDMDKAWFQSRYDKVGPAEPANRVKVPTISTARSRNPITWNSMPRCWQRRKPNSRTGKRARRISRAACRSK